MPRIPRSGLAVHEERPPSGTDSSRDRGENSSRDLGRRLPGSCPRQSCRSPLGLMGMNPVASVFASRELLWNLTLRELRTKYRRSFLGWTWSMLNPLANVAIYFFVFGVLFDAEAPRGVNSGIHGFAWFLLCALLPWNYWALINNSGLGAISANAGLVRRVAFPREVLVFSTVLHATVQFAIELGLLCVILLFVGSPFLPWLPIVLVTVVLLGIFASGFALALSALSVYFKDLAYLWGIVLQVWFFATPIVYNPDLIDEQAPSSIRPVLDNNPMKLVVEIFRDCLYHAQAPKWDSLGIFAIWAFASLGAGWWAFRHLDRRLAEEV
ncbi:MAG: ABC transporter [Acidimicrobiales bacterium mtb01]|nr:ABC transporter permease [Actinomycetota bacterium]TEX47949.1 MAG: ABC transporter [Acidimicrobiales bacterium mtb01]